MQCNGRNPPKKVRIDPDRGGIGTQWGYYELSEMLGPCHWETARDYTDVKSLRSPGSSEYTLAA